MLQFKDEDFYCFIFSTYFSEDCEMKDGSGGILRTALFALAMLFALAAPALASSDGVTNYRALLIGNSSYQSQNDLKSCVYDLTAMRSALASGSVGYKKTASYSNLTKSGIQSAVNGVLAWGADDDDVTVFYYTGHGASSGLVGVEHSSSANGIYPFAQLQSVLSGVPGKVIVLLDSCESGGLINKSAAASETESFTDNAIAAFSGASGGLFAKAITSGDKFHVIASSSQDQSSYAMTNLYGLATWSLCEAMGWSHNGSKAGNRLEVLEGDANGDLTVTVGEAYAYAAPAIAEALSKQTKKYVQDMKAYPENSDLTLIARSAASTAIETPKNATLVKGVLNLTTACIAPGKTLQLQLNVSGATNVSWGSSKNAVATVDHTGLVTGVKYSYAYRPEISVLYKDKDGKWCTASCFVRVLPARYVVQSVKPKYDTKPLEKGASYTMTAKVYPSSARYKKLRWSSSNDAVATVNPTTGRITAVSDTGTAVITATATSGVTATVTVNAIPARARSVSLNYKTRTLIPGQPLTLTATVLPASTKNKHIDWKSSREDIATVDDTGMVTANKDGVYGRTVISATTENSKVAYCTVTVVKNQSIPRTKPRNSSGNLVASARRIYYNGTGSLVIDMYFSNRTRYAQTVPTPNPGLVVLKLKNVKNPLYANVTFTSTVKVPSGGYRLYTIKLNLEEYPVFSGLDLRGSDATYEAKN
jgi:uncharacterized protein YjdB